jgi:hypothetical protein
MIAIHSFGQSTFQIVIGQDIYPSTAYDMVKTFDGGYMIGGNTYYSGMSTPDGIYLQKVNGNGQPQLGRIWKRESVFEWINSIRQTPDSGFMMLGTNDSIYYNPGPVRGPKNCFLGKADSQGQILWIKKFYKDQQPCFPVNLENTSDGNFIILSNPYNSSTSQNILHLMKTDPSGDTIWTRSYFRSGSSGAFAVKQTNDGGYIISATGTLNFKSKPSLIKVNSTGNIDWQKSFDMFQVFRGLEVTNDGGFVLLGNDKEGHPDSAGISVIKTDNLGNVSWSFLYNNIRSISGKSIIQTTDGGYLITGYWQDTIANNKDLLLLKIDNLGNFQWSKRYGSPDLDLGTKSIQNLNGYTVVGSYGYVYLNQYQRIYLVQTDLNGNSGCYEESLNINSQIQPMPVDTFTFSEGNFIYDEVPFSPVPFYGLEKEILCSSVGIADNQSDNRLEIFPSPASDKIKILSDEQKYFNLEIMDTFGRVLLVQKDNSDNTIDISNYPNGIYFIKVEINNMTIVRRFIKS